MKKLEKRTFVGNLGEELKSSTSVVLVNYTGLSVKLQQDLKKRLKEVGAKMQVSKNSLFKLAAKNAELDGEVYSDSVLEGPVALIMTTGDPVAPIQVLGKFAKEFEIPQFKVGIVDGSFQNKEALDKISKLPTKEVLYGQVVGSISSPLYGIVGVLNANMQKLIYILKTKSEM